MKIRMLAAIAAPIALTVAASAQEAVIDGVVDAAYGDAVLVQDTQTQFGDSNLGTIDFANGSELDGAFAYIANDTLFVVFAGNLESNYNKLDVFIDAIPGEGQNPILGNNNDIDFGALNRMGRFEDPDTGEVQPGLTFDDGFEPDFWITFTGGPGAEDKKGNTPYDTYVNYAELLTGGGDFGFAGYAGPGGAGAAGALITDNFIQAAIDNSNVAGVTGGDQLEPDGGAGVTTGIEIAIPLGVLNHTAGNAIRICAFVNGGGHDFVSNQVVGPLGGGANLGEPRFVNFNDLPGEQFFTVPTGGSGGGCFGDFNDDGVVNGADFGSLLAAWGPCPGCPADLNEDGDVNGADVGLLLSVWGACP